MVSSNSFPASFNAAFQQAENDKTAAIDNAISFFILKILSYF